MSGKNIIRYLGYKHAVCDCLHAVRRVCFFIVSHLIYVRADRLFHQHRNVTRTKVAMSNQKLQRMKIYIKSKCFNNIVTIFRKESKAVNVIFPSTALTTYVPKVYYELYPLEILLAAVDS